MRMSSSFSCSQAFGSKFNACFRRSMPKRLQHSFFSPSTFQASAREDAQQVVLKGKIEARGARVALAAGAPAQLVVDASRFVAFRPQDVQAAEPHHLLVLHVRDGAETRDELLPVLPPARV